MDHLCRVTQQRLWDLALEHLSEQARQGILQHQPDPADQHEHGNPAGQAGLAIDKDETADAGQETAQRDDAGVALEQLDHADDEMGYRGMDATDKNVSEARQALSR